MKLTPQDQEAVLRLVEEGVEASSSKLAAISRTRWELRTTSLKAYAGPEDYAELGRPGQDCFGAYCHAPGKMFLAYFTARSAALLGRAFLAGSRRSAEAKAQVQEAAVAEVSNIFINAVASHFADRCGMAFILPPPKLARGSRLDIIRSAFGSFPAVGKVFSATITLASDELSADCTMMMMLDDLILNFVLEALDR